MKLILVGLGNCGYEWYCILKRDYNPIKVAVVDIDLNARNRIESGDPFYLSLTDAIEVEEPDFILNATPPEIHTAINTIAFDHGIPVLCESPISDSYQDALQIVERAIQNNIPFMVAENFRHAPCIRKVKKLIVEGVIGALATIHIDFRRSYQTEKDYFVKMQHPLLLDVAPHHLDLIRYITGSEGKTIFARSYNPPGSWFKGNMALYLVLEMEKGIAVIYNGNMVARSPETSWHGNWIIEGTEGAITLINDTIHLSRNGQTILVDNTPQLRSTTCLDEFILSLQYHRQPETGAANYLGTEALVYTALESTICNNIVAISLIK